MKEYKLNAHMNDDLEIKIHSLYKHKNILDQYFKNSSIELTIRKKVYRFSDALRSYYFGVIIPELKKAWFNAGISKSEDQCDREMREKYLYYEEYVEDLDQNVKIIHTLRRSDTKVNNEMMKTYCHLCIIWAAENLNWQIPYPNEDINEHSIDNIII